MKTPIAIVLAAVILSGAAIFIMANKPKWDCAGKGGTWYSSCVLPNKADGICPQGMSGRVPASFGDPDC